MRLCRYDGPICVAAAMRAIAAITVATGDSTTMTQTTSL